MSVYEVTVERGDRYWLVHVPAIGHATQARSLREVEPMVRDLIAVISGEHLDPEDVQLDVRVELPNKSKRTCSATASCSRDQRWHRPKAAAEWRSAARNLAAHGMTCRDIGGHWASLISVPSNLSRPADRASRTRTRPEDPPAAGSQTFPVLALGHDVAPNAQVHHRHDVIIGGDRTGSGTVAVTRAPPARCTAGTSNPSRLSPITADTGC